MPKWIERAPGEWVPRTIFFPGRGMYSIRTGPEEVDLGLDKADRLYCAMRGDEGFFQIDDAGLAVSGSRIPVIEPTRAQSGRSVFCFDADGALYRVVGPGGWYSFKFYAVRKEKDGKPLADFAFWGKDRLDVPREYLGDPKSPGDGERHFGKIVDMCVDHEGTI